MSLGKLSGIDYSLNTKKSSIENFEQIEEQKKYDNIFSTNNYDATFEASTEEDLANKILDLVAKKSNKKVQEEQSNPYELG
ncbi:hypothetical protein II906_04840, partial [bacterium]|nr:hypothetical protein [bacterium]